jgi:hypothetical protein
MDYLKKTDADEWFNLEDKQINEILEKLDKIPDLTSLRDQLYEFKNALSLLKKSRKPSLAENVHHRARYLVPTLESMKNQFEELYKKSAKLSEIDEFFVNKFLIVDAILSNRNKYSFFVEKKQDFVIGRTNIPGLSNYVSRALLNVVVNLNAKTYTLQYIGSTPCRITNEFGAYIDFNSKQSKSIQANLGQYMTVSNNNPIDTFRFTVRNIA